MGEFVPYFKGRLEQARVMSVYLDSRKGRA